MLTFSNPRKYAEFDDWPLSSNRAGKCVFAVEEKNGRYRVGRTTTGKTKYHTFGGPIAIVDGDDGRTYILQKSSIYESVTVSRSDFKNASTELSYVHKEHPRFAELMALIEQANK